MRLVPVRPERSRVRRNGARERVGGTRGRNHRTGEIIAVPVFGRSEHGNGRDGLQHGQAELGSGRHGNESEGGELGNGRSEVDHGLESHSHGDFSWPFFCRGRMTHW